MGTVFGQTYPTLIT